MKTICSIDVSKLASVTGGALSLAPLVRAATDAVKRPMPLGPFVPPKPDNRS